MASIKKVETTKEQRMKAIEEMFGTVPPEDRPSPQEIDLIDKFRTSEIFTKRTVKDFFDYWTDTILPRFSNAPYEAQCAYVHTFMDMDRVVQYILGQMAATILNRFDMTAAEYCRTHPENPFGSYKKMTDCIAIASTLDHDEYIELDNMRVARMLSGVEDAQDRKVLVKEAIQKKLTVEKMKDRIERYYEEKDSRNKEKRELEERQKVREQKAILKKHPIQTIIPRSEPVIEPEIETTEIKQKKKDEIPPRHEESSLQPQRQHTNIGIRHNQMLIEFADDVDCEIGSQIILSMLPSIQVKIAKEREKRGR